MAHEDKGNYAGKHSGQMSDPAVVEKLKKIKEQARITCAAAHRVASDLKIPPEDIGIQVDLMELRIVQCQLGLFGHPPESRPVDNNMVVSDELNKRLEITAEEGRISCKACWDIAKEFKVNRLDMGGACEKLGIRIKPCQLGAF